MTYDVLLAPDVHHVLEQLDDKSHRIVRENLEVLEESPYPGDGAGDKEKLPVEGEERYRMHIGRTWTVFYSILEDENEVRVSELLPIDDAHKKYGY